MIGHEYTAAEIDWLRENRFQPSALMTEQFNALFGTNISSNALKQACLRRGIYSGIDGQFVKCNIPWNLGLKGVNGTSSTTWRKGNIPPNHRPVGSERINKDGYIEIKVKEPRTWTAKQRYIWEQHHGPLPKSSVVLFADQDNRNFDIENLAMLTRSELAKLNKIGYKKQHDEIKPSLIALVKLEDQIRIRSK
jgi:hypothetical protein